MHAVADSLPIASVSPRQGCWSRWVAFLDRREPGTSLALFRIGCGLCVLGSLGSVVVHGLVPAVWLDSSQGGICTSLGLPWQFKLLGGVSPLTLWLMIALALVGGLLLAVGLAGRLSALVALQAYLAVTDLSPYAHGADDALLANALWLLVLSQSTATLSLACRWRTGRWTSHELVPAWPRYLAIYQLVLVYWTTGLQKVSIYWTPTGDFSALYYILQEPPWQRWDMSWLAWIYPVTQVATATTWIWEVTAPLVLLAFWYRHTRERKGWLRAAFNWLHFREVFVVIGIGMHLTILVFMALGVFSWISFTYYFCFFHPAEWQAAGRWLARQVRGNPNQEAEGQIHALPLSGEANQPATPSRAWVKQVRGVFVALHLLAITLKSLPSPDGCMDRDFWKNPKIQEEFGAWCGRLEGWGITVTPPELENKLWNLAEVYMKVREKVLAPFRPYYEYFGARQGWPMFVGPDLTPSRLCIDVNEGGHWRTVFIERDPNHTWLASTLDHERMRTLVYTIVFFDHQVEYNALARWLAVRAARDFPAATEIRLRLYKYRTPTPEEVRAGQPIHGEFVQPVVVKLEGLR